MNCIFFSLLNIIIIIETKVFSLHTIDRMNLKQKNNKTQLKEKQKNYFLTKTSAQSNENTWPKKALSQLIRTETLFYELDTRLRNELVFFFLLLI